jgi:hypothetical protein
MVFFGFKEGIPPLCPGLPWGLSGPAMGAFRQGSPCCNLSFGSFQYAYGYHDRSNQCPHLAESAYLLE